MASEVWAAASAADPAFAVWAADTAADPAFAVSAADIEADPASGVWAADIEADPASVAEVPLAVEVQAEESVEAEEQAEQIVENAKLEAEQKHDELLETYMHQGYAEGKEQAEQECSDLKKKLEQQIKDNEDDYEKQVSELEPAFVEILIKYLEKLTGIYAGERPEVIMHVIHQAMTKQTSCRNFIIRVSPSDYGNVINQKPEIMLWLPEGSQVEVVEDKMLSDGGCLIETDTRIFDCSIETQLRSLKEDLRLLAADVSD